MRLESNVSPSILTVSESWITESSNLTEERLDIVFNRCDVPKRTASDLSNYVDRDPRATAKPGHHQITTRYQI